MRQKMNVLPYETKTVMCKSTKNHGHLLPPLPAARPGMPVLYPLYKPIYCLNFKACLQYCTDFTFKNAFHVAG